MILTGRLLLQRFKFKIKFLALKILDNPKVYQVFEKICQESVQNGHTKNKDSKTSLKKKQKQFKVWAESDKDFESPNYATIIFI